MDHDGAPIAYPNQNRSFVQLHTHRAYRSVWTIGCCSPQYTYSVSIRDQPGIAFFIFQELSTPLTSRAKPQAYFCPPVTTSCSWVITRKHSSLVESFSWLEPTGSLLLALIFQFPETCIISSGFLGKIKSFHIPSR